jgi:hypothetical protein
MKRPRFSTTVLVAVLVVGSIAMQVTPARAGASIPLIPKVPDQAIRTVHMQDWLQKNVSFELESEEPISVDMQLDVFDAQGNRLASDLLGPARMKPGENFLVMFDESELGHSFLVMFDKGMLPASVQILGSSVVDIGPRARAREHGLVMFDQMATRPKAYGLLRVHDEMPGRGKRRGVSERSLGMFPPGPFPIDDQGRPIAARAGGGADYSLVITLWDSRSVKERVESRALVMFLKAQK